MRRKTRRASGQGAGLVLVIFWDMANKFGYLNGHTTISSSQLTLDAIRQQGSFVLEFLQNAFKIIHLLS